MCASVGQVPISNVNLGKKTIGKGRKKMQTRYEEQLTRTKGPWEIRVDSNYIKKNRGKFWERRIEQSDGLMARGTLESNPRKFRVIGRNGRGWGQGRHL